MSDSLTSVSTLLDVGLDEPLELCTLGKNPAAAWNSMANLLHLQMFQCDVKNDIFADECDLYSNEVEFLEACRNYVCLDPNALTSDQIWRALQNAVVNAVVELSE